MMEGNRQAHGEFLHVCEVVWDSEKLVAVIVMANYILLVFCKQTDMPNTKPAGNAQTVTTWVTGHPLKSSTFISLRPATLFCFLPLLPLLGWEDTRTYMLQIESTPRMRIRGPSTAHCESLLGIHVNKSATWTRGRKLVWPKVKETSKAQWEMNYYNPGDNNVVTERWQPKP